MCIVILVFYCFAAFNFIATKQLSNRLKGKEKYAASARSHKVR